MKFKTAFTFWLPVVYCIMLAVYIGIRYWDGNILWSRLAPLSGHTTVWMAILLFAAFLRLNLDDGFKGLFKWIITVLFVIAVIEGSFQVAFAFSDLRNMISPFPALMISIGIGSGMAMQAYKMFDFRWLIPFFLFMMFWFSIGMPITVTNHAMTVFYYDIPVNTLEIFQWLIGTGGFFAGLKTDMEMKLNE